MLARLGKIGEACIVSRKTIEETPADTFALMVTAFEHALVGEKQSLLERLKGEFYSYCWHDPELPEWVAGWLALVNEREKALDWLERWVDRGAFNYPMLAYGDPLLENLRGEPRFQRLLDRIRPTWESFVPRFSADEMS
jgi:hypothetical protein